MDKQEYKKCVNCRNDRLIKYADGHIRNVCTIDGHVIGYLECFCETCEKWGNGRNRKIIDVNELNAEKFKEEAYRTGREWILSNFKYDYIEREQ